MTNNAETIDIPASNILRDGEFSQVDVKDADIGGELLPILSKGLYTFPLHCIREYAQNAIDAHASQIRIKITSSAVIIHDDGRGMDYGELVNARRFGVSAKDIEFFVGFRGIGIYSSFDLCNRLLITTKKAGGLKAYVLEFDFGAMKSKLAMDKQADPPNHTALTELLTKYSRLSQESELPERHYTTVELEDISGTHIKQLSDRDELRKYILRNLPVDFSAKFVHRDEINARLGKEVPGYKAVKIVLESDTSPRETIAKPAIPYLGEPIMDSIKNSDGEKIAFYWGCLREPSDAAGVPRGRIPDEFSDYRGFVYKVKGFTVGDNARLSSVFKKGNSGLYWWYTGEIFVINPGVLPNTARDDFETNAARRALEKGVHDALKRLEAKAGAYQEQSRALDRFKDRAKDLDRLERSINDGAYNDLETYSELDDAITELRSQKGKLPDDQRSWGQELIKRADRLKILVSRGIDSPQGTPKTRREAARRQAAEGRVQSTFLPTSQPAVEGPVLKSLAQFVEGAGWALADDCARLINILDRSLADVLGSGSDHHQKVMADIEAKLAAELSS